MPVITYLRQCSPPKLIITLLLGLNICLQTADADGGAYASDTVKENQLEAAFIYNFIKFTTWQGDKALDKTHQVEVCVLGMSPFNGALDNLKKASNASLTFVVKENISVADIPACHVLFVSLSEKSNVDSIIADARGHSVLTVSKIGGFADKGGIIEMVKVEKSVGLFSKDKINLRINMQAAADAPVSIDAQLLEVAAEILHKR